MPSKLLLTRRIAIVVSSFFLLSVSACKKSGSSGDSGADHINFKFDGSAQSYTLNIGALNQDNTNGIPSQLVISASKAADPTKSYFAVYLRSDQPLVTGKAYTETIIPNTASPYGGLFYMDAAGGEFSTIEFNQSSPTKVTVTLTTLTSTVVAGTFSGMLYDENASTAQSHQVTEGEFKVKRLN